MQLHCHSRHLRCTHATRWLTHDQRLLQLLQRIFIIFQAPKCQQLLNQLAARVTSSTAGAPSACMPAACIPRPRARARVPLPLPASAASHARMLQLPPPAHPQALASLGGALEESVIVAGRLLFEHAPQLGQQARRRLGLASERVCACACVHARRERADTGCTNARACEHALRCGSSDVRGGAARRLRLAALRCSGCSCHPLRYRPPSTPTCALHCCSRRLDLLLHLGHALLPAARAWGLAGAPSAPRD